MRIPLKRFTGFTLVEIMIVVALMSVITVVAVANYSQYVQTARRADGVAVMQEVRHAMERHYAKTFSYAGAVSGADYPSKSPKDGDDVYYTLAVSITDEGRAYLITATGVGAQASDKCKNLTMTNTGILSNGASLNNDDCF